MIGQDRKQINGLRLVRIDGTIERITSDTPNGNWLFGGNGEKLVRVRTVSADKPNNRHAHNYPHTTICLEGTIDVHLAAGGNEQVITLAKGESFFLPAFVEHEIFANGEQARFYCLFDHRNDIGDIVNKPDDMEYAY